MLNSNIVREIEEFVYKKPRSIQEVSLKIKKNWRTADRYLLEIEKEYGTIATRVFRGGTRGALKIAYWAAIEKVSNSVFQKILEEDLMRGKKKEEFSAFDIFQYVDNENKKAQLEYEETENKTSLIDFENFLLQTKKQLLIFSGNLSFINFRNKEVNIFEVFDKLIKKGINMKIVCRVDIAGKENIEKVLALNFKHGKENIEIRHREQPLRAVIMDNKVFRIKEIKEPTGRKHELSKKSYIFYTIKDKEWTEWLSRIFWKMFSSSMDANKRFQELNKINVKHL